MSGLSWKIDLRPQARAQVHAAAAAAIGDAAEFLLEEANRTVPIEEATLQRSGSTSVDGLKAAVAYDTPYAVRQHEVTYYRHDPGRRAKWLEHTFKEQAKRVGEFLASKIRGRL